MNCLRFVIAVPDDEFAIEIQSKLEETVGENAEILIITDKVYFRDFFSSPKNLNVILVDKSFYSKELENHNIDLVCILSNKNEDCQRVNAGSIYVIHKDSGVDKITQMMLSAVNPEMINRSIQEGQKAKIILVTSPLGGSGKTVTALAISYYLKKSGLRVLFVDPTNLQSSEYWLKDANSMEDEYISENLTPDCWTNLVIHGKTDHIALFSQVLAAVDVKTEDYFQIIESAQSSGEYDYIVVDSESDFSAESIRFMTLADRVLVLLLQDQQSVHKAEKFLRCFDCSDETKYTLCCSKFCINKKSFLKENMIPVAGNFPMINLDNAQLEDVGMLKCISRITSELL